MGHQGIRRWLADQDTFLLGLSEFNFLSADRNFKAGGTDFPTQRSIQQLVMYIDFITESMWKSST